MRRGPLVVVGDAVLDEDLVGRAERLCPDAPVPVLDGLESRQRPGGAGLAASLAVHHRETVLVAPMGDDEAGDRLRALLADHGVHLVPLPSTGGTATKTRVRCDGQSLLRLDRGARGVVGPLTPEARRAVESAAAVLVADYGRGTTADPGIRRVLAPAPRRPVVWDPHPRGGDPVPRTTLVTPNDDELGAPPSPAGGSGLAQVAAAGRARRRAWGVDAVAVTLGAAGALLVDSDGPPLVVPSPSTSSAADTCGAGDCFAATAAAALAAGALVSEAVMAGVDAASAFVARGGASAVGAAPGSGAADLRPATRPSSAATAPDAAAVALACRQAGGTLVTTSGCFDLLHAGHLDLLRRARDLGDALVVLLNSDDSVCRLKGAGRPLVPAAERADLLLALDCVDAVWVFEDDVPLVPLERLRPDVFAKGGDYRLAELPEEAVLARWGGQAVILPYVPDHSTTRLLEEATRAHIA